MKPKYKILIATLVLFVSLFSVFSLASAQGLVKCGRQLPAGATPAQIAANECTIGNLITMIMRIINFLLSWAWLVAILFIVWSGWNMIGARGNSEALESAKASLQNAVIGFFLIMVSFVLLNFIISILTGNGIPRAGALLDAFNLLKI